ncbi:MalY/PatB family protein [Providencia burhodogranariea]|uniref:cysteine-S-conjugate beta-lyase n=1 Tax=Providencia burhodogranariea DSM 19968 TaxID=1141662 RepID=K8WI65_9GAMM|nr:MalY/PatB family protein [Providencia burhodogranariea]EKT60239.1 bifunctional beta-cystathionase/maltose regulon regulatory protein [Providencia burhodogranariea DSM 19968]
MKQYDSFSQPVDRLGTYCTQWDFVQDRFGEADLLPFTISDMDFATAPEIIEALLDRTRHGVFGYSRWQHADFLNAIQRWFKTRFNSEIQTEEIVYGPSVIYMVSQLIRQWSEIGDGVVVHTPAYDAFYKTIEGTQRKVLTNPLTYKEGQWVCDMQQLEELLALPTTRVMLLCSPHNPTGKVWTASELSLMAKLCERHNVRVISDEIHMDLCWENAQHIPWSTISRVPYALFTSASKSFNIPALTGAYGIINDNASRDAYFHQLKACDGLSSPAILAVIAHITAYTECDDWFRQLRDYLFANLVYVKTRLDAEFPQLNWQIPESTYLAWINLNPLSIDDNQLQNCLIHQEKVAIMPGFTYGIEGNGFIRLNVGCPRAKLEIGMDRLIRALKSCQITTK